MTYLPGDLVRIIDGDGFLSNMIGIVIARYNENNAFDAFWRIPPKGVLLDMQNSCAQMTLHIPFYTKTLMEKRVSLLRQYLMCGLEHYDYPSHQTRHDGAINTRLHNDTPCWINCWKLHKF